MPGPLFGGRCSCCVGADTQSGQINFQAITDNVIGVFDLRRQPVVGSASGGAGVERSQFHRALYSYASV
jgi:hypothetical protein